MAEAIRIVRAAAWGSAHNSGWIVDLGGYHHSDAVELEIEDFLVADFAELPDGAGTCFLLVDVARVPANGGPEKLLRAITESLGAPITFTGDALASLRVDRDESEPLPAEEEAAINRKAGG